MRSRVTGALGALRGFGRTLQQQDAPAQPAPPPARPPSLADLARARGKGGVEQTKAPVAIRARDVEPEEEIHPVDKTYARPKGSTGPWKKRAVSTTGRSLVPPKQK